MAPIPTEVESLGHPFPYSSVTVADSRDPSLDAANLVATWCRQWLDCGHSHRCICGCLVGLVSLLHGLTPCLHLLRIGLLLGRDIVHLLLVQGSSDLTILSVRGETLNGPLRRI